MSGWCLGDQPRMRREFRCPLYRVLAGPHLAQWFHLECGWKSGGSLSPIMNTSIVFQAVALTASSSPIWVKQFFLKVMKAWIPITIPSIKIKIRINVLWSCLSDISAWVLSLSPSPAAHFGHSQGYTVFPTVWASVVYSFNQWAKCLVDIMTLAADGYMEQFLSMLVSTAIGLWKHRIPSDLRS